MRMDLSRALARCHPEHHGEFGHHPLHFVDDSVRQRRGERICGYGFGGLQQFALALSGNRCGEVSRNDAHRCMQSVDPSEHEFQIFFEHGGALSIEWRVEEPRFYGLVLGQHHSQGGFLMSNEQDGIPMFARGPYGKCDDEIKFRCQSELKFEAQALAYSYGMDLSDFVRELLTTRVRGVAHAESIATARIRAVAGVLGQTGNDCAPRGEQT